MLHCKASLAVYNFIPFYGGGSAPCLAEASHWFPSFPGFPRGHQVSFGSAILTPGFPRFLLFVHFHVLPQMRTLAEALAAFTALVRLLPGVCSLMLDQVGTLAEAAATFVTLVGFFSSVNSLVLNEIGALLKPFSTLITFIGLLPGMDPPVLDEVRTLKETFPTISASVRFLSGMDLLVLEES